MAERHVMLDLETMSTRPDAAIVAIGAYFFDPYADDRADADPVRMYHAPVSLDDSIAAGLHVSGETVGWWMQQSDEARAALFTDPAPLITALFGLRDAILERTFAVEDVIIWSHAGFDFPILDHAYDVVGVAKPYWYRSPRDMRTIIHAAYGRNLDVEEEEPGFPVNPLTHHAGHDAWHQAVMVQYCFRKLSLASIRPRG